MNNSPFFPGFSEDELNRDGLPYRSQAELSRIWEKAIAADGTSAKDDSRPYKMVRTETLSPEGILIINFKKVPKV